VIAARLNYVELPAGNIAASRQFFEAAFGWLLTEFGPDYAATVGNGCDLGLHGDLAEAVSAPLPVIEVDDLEAALAAVEAAGGAIVRPIFAFPGGRRFHFREPSGNEMAVYINEPG
jgi:predicted enzyme related to lactoylglutathione lyase